MSLYLDKKTHSYIWKELPIDEGVIDRVEELAYKERHLLHADDHPLFEWFSGHEVIHENKGMN